MSSVDLGLGQPGDERLTTAILSDSLDAVGLRHQVLTTQLSPVVPGSRALGRATVIEFRVSPEFDNLDPYRGAIEFIDRIKAGSLVVVASGEDCPSALWGELFSAAALGAGAVGVISDGNLRDTDKISALGFPAFSSGRRPADYKGRMRVIATEKSILMHGVEIQPGDIVCADDDGTVVVPARVEDSVLELARKRANAESTVLAELLSGETLSTVWARHRVL